MQSPAILKGGPAATRGPLGSRATRWSRAGRGARRGGSLEELRGVARLGVAQV